MLKYSIGSLTVVDDETTKTQEDIILRLVGVIKGYTEAARNIYENEDVSIWEKLAFIKNYCIQVKAIYDFLEFIGVNVKTKDGSNLTSEIEKYFKVLKQNLDK